MDNDVQREVKISSPSWKVWLGFVLLSPAIFAALVGTVIFFQQRQWKRFHDHAMGESRALLTGRSFSDPWVQGSGPALTSYLMSPSESDDFLRLKLLVNRRGKWGREDIDLDRDFTKVQNWSRRELVGDEFSGEWTYLYKLSREGQTTIEALRVN